METLIKGGRLVPDNWQRLEAADGRWLRTGEDGLLPDFPEDVDLLVPLAIWRARKDDLLARRGRNGVRLEPHEGPELIAADLERLALVAVNFPEFDDGRGYSTARLLRERYGYRGELRAVGDVLRDQLLFLARSGFDAFELREDQEPHAALAAFGELSEQYQSSATEPLPLFRRRLARSASRASR
jgi:uncharacterized protein (DUF934 family)